MKTLEERIKELEDALRPFAAIADEYDKDGLDEARPDWVTRGVKKFDVNVELYSGRGGKELMTLGHVLKARDVLNNVKTPTPVIDPFIAKVREFYEASIPNLPWTQMSEERRKDVIENYRKLMGDDEA